jgi:hypothetical protein
MAKIARSLGFVALATSFASPVLAQSTPTSALTLEWIAPGECPSRDEVFGEMQRLLGGPQPPLSGERWTARAVVSHEGGWSVSIETSSASGPHWRTLRAQTCRGLADATALILALAINPRAVAQSVPAPVAMPSPGPASSPTKAPMTVIVTAPTRRRPIQFSVGLPLSFSAGVLPEIDYGIGGALGIRVDSVVLELAVQDWLRPVVATIPASRAGGTFGLFSGTLYACNAFRTGPFETGPCAELDVGRIEATGFGVTSGTTGSALWLAAGMGALAVTNLDASGKWAVPIHLDALVPVERHSFVIQNVPGVVYRQSSIAGRASVEVERRFW